MKRRPIVERFWEKVRWTPDCWLWTAGKSDNGKGYVYGYFAVESKKIRRAHRVAYEQLIGPIPEGFDLHHECKRTLCVRIHPEHVRLVGRLEHSRIHHQKRPTYDGCNAPSDLVSIT